MSYSEDPNRQEAHRRRPRPDVHRLRALERDELLGAQGGRRDRPGDVPARTTPARDVWERLSSLPALPVPRPRHRVQRLMGLDPRLRRAARHRRRAARRAAHRRRRRRGRAAVPHPAGLGRRRVRRGRTRSAAVYDDRALGATSRSSAAPPDGAPASGMLGARLGPHRRQRGSRRAPLAHRRRRRARRHASDAGCRVRPNHVYLADGVGRHFGIVGSSGSGGTPGVTPPELIELRSTARPASRPALPRAARPAVAPAAERARPRHRARHIRRAAGPRRPAGPLHGAPPVARPVDRPLQRRGRTRRRRPRAARPPGRPRHVHHRRDPPDLPGRRGSTTPAC